MRQCELEEGELPPVLARNAEHMHSRSCYCFCISFFTVVSLVYFCHLIWPITMKLLFFQLDQECPNICLHYGLSHCALPSPCIWAQIQAHDSKKHTDWNQAVRDVCQWYTKQVGRLFATFDIFVSTGSFFVSGWGCTHVCSNTGFLLVLQITVVCYKFEMCISYLTEGLWLTRLEESGSES